MKDRIAILGWGSLIWDLDNLAPFVEGQWAMRGGPAFPLEFSRVSPKRLMGLAVCIDPEAGQDCPSHAIASRRRSVAEARADLAARERAPLDLIGAVCMVEGTRLGRSATSVAAWCAATGAAGAVWTDLRPNFAETAGGSFSAEAGERYLQGLAGDSFAEALRYIEFAPGETDTPLRRRLAAAPWWREAAANLRPGGAQAR